MKKLLLLITITIPMVAFAQSSLIATLSNDKEISTYYGETAFNEAYEAAKEGDCITLSSGTFECVSKIEKAITIRGAGYLSDSDAGMTSTYLYVEEGKHELCISFKEEPSSKLIIEGISFNGVSVGASSNDDKGLKKELVDFQKCSFESIKTYTYNPFFTHCIINRWYSDYATTHLYNCIMTNAIPDSYGTTGTEYNHCVVFGTYYGVMSYGIMKNCILIGDYISSTSKNNLKSENIFNCVAYTCDNVDIFSVLKDNDTNKMVDGLSGLFKNYSKDYKTTPSNYELSDQSKTTYIGDDGTQIGIYGGANPFSVTLSNPRITNFSIETNQEDGKLKVKLNVK